MCDPKSKIQNPRFKSGLTLAELLVVIAVLSVLGSLVLPVVGNYLAESRGDVTRQSLARLREVISQYWQDRVQLTNGVRVNALPQPNPSVAQTPSRLSYPQVAFLFWNPNFTIPNETVDYDPTYRVGWRGPYLACSGATYTINTAANFTEQYGENGDPTVLDGWANPIVIQNPGLAPDGVGQDVRLVSAGPDGVVNTPPGVLTANLLPGQTGDDVYVSFELR